MSDRRGRFFRNAFGFTLGAFVAFVWVLRPVLRVIMERRRWSRERDALHASLTPVDWEDVERRARG